MSGASSVDGAKINDSLEYIGRSWISYELVSFQIGKFWFVAVPIHPEIGLIAEDDTIRKKLGSV